MARFANINFNLMRAIEIFQDMNHQDMDVSAPPSNRNFSKELEVAEILNNCLTELLDNGFFRDCEPRDSEDDDSEIISNTPESSGFNYQGQSPSPSEESSVEQRSPSRESFTRRFRRYVRRMVGGGSRDDEEQEEEENERVTGRSSGGSSSSSRNRFLGIGRTVLRAGKRMLRPEDADIREPEHFDEGNSMREHSSSSSTSTSTSSRPAATEEESQERTSSEPFDPNVVYPHRHRHKHNHPGPHHHHSHSAPGNHVHSYQGHSSRSGSSTSSRRGGNLTGAETPRSDEEIMEANESLVPRQVENKPKSRSSRKSRSSSKSSRGSRGR